MSDEKSWYDPDWKAHNTPNGGEFCRCEKPDCKQKSHLGSASGCCNQRFQGRFVGDLCAPCAEGVQQ